MRRHSFECYVASILGQIIICRQMGSSAKRLLRHPSHRKLQRHENAAPYCIDKKRATGHSKSLSNNPSKDYYTQGCLEHFVRARQEISHCKYWSLPCSYNILTSLGVSSTTNDLHIQSFPAYLQILFFQIVLINYYDRRL